MTTSNNNTTKYFDLKTTGIGYVNRIREVKPAKGKPYFALNIAALTGDSNSKSYTFFDCLVTGEKAKDLFREHFLNSKEENKILISFVLGDLRAETFVYSKGDKIGSTGVSLKARLLKINSIKIDNEYVYQANENGVNEAQELQNINEAQELQNINEGQELQNINEAQELRNTNENQQTEVAINDITFQEVEA